MLHKVTKAVSISGDLIGATGRRYLFKELIQERPLLGHVWLATCGKDKFVLKEIPKNIFSTFKEDIRPQLHGSSYIRLPLDTIPDQRVLVYEYLDDDCLTLVRKDIPLQAKKQVLRAALQGLSNLHDRDIVHLDIKPDNIMVNWRQNGQNLTIDKVQVTDLENAAHLPKGRCIKGMLPGNENWRSPEGHCKGPLNKPTDIFSFGAVCIFALLGRVIFGTDDDFVKHQAQGVFATIIRFQRQVSYFGDEEGIKGIIKHVSDNEVHQKVFQMLWEDRKEDDIPYIPFSDWPEIRDIEFQSLIKGLMNLDPKGRLTANQALKHPWFSESSSLSS